MEVTGGLIGAVSLGMQLVGTVQKVTTFIRSIQDAPEDLASLGSSVDQLETILHRVTTLIESQSQHTDAPGSLDLLERAVRNCEPNVTKLGKLVDKLQKKVDQGGKRRVAWASLKLVVKKEDLDRYRSLILGDLMALNTAIAFGAYEMTLQQVVVARTHRSLDRISVLEHSGIASRSDPTLPHGEQDQVQDMHPTSTWMACGQKRGRRNVISTISRARIYQGFFGHIYVKKKTTHLSRKQEGTTPISEEVVYFLHPSFLRVAIELHQVIIGGKLSRSLRYCPILPGDSEIFDICLYGDLERFRQALIRQEVPVHAENSNGMTLLHMACTSGNLELCSLLIELGVDASHENVWGQKALAIFCDSIHEFDHCFEAMMRLMILGQDHVDEYDILDALDCYHGPPDGFEYLLSPDVYPTELDWRRLPRKRVVQILKPFAIFSLPWTNLVRRMVRQAEDLHCSQIDSTSASSKPLTLLDQLFGMTSDPIRGAEVSEAWLEILAMERLDVREYLKVEMELHEDNFIPPYRFNEPPRRFLVFDLGEKPNVKWDWWIDPDDPASLVCDEFRQMACKYDNSDMSYGWLDTWPFIIPRWAEYLDWENFDPAINRLWRHMVYLAHSRAARRVSKKAMRVARAEGTYRRKLMPGSWID